MTTDEGREENKQEAQGKGGEDKTKEANKRRKVKCGGRKGEEKRGDKRRGEE